MAQSKLRMDSLKFQIAHRLEKENDGNSKESYESRLKTACQVVFAGKMSMGAAASLYHVSKAAVHRGAHALKDGRDIGKTGPPTYLRQEQEQVLLDRITNADPTLFPTKAEVILEGTKLIAQDYRPSVPSLSYGWIRSFLKRHQDEVKGMMAESMESVRIIGQNIISK